MRLGPLIALGEGDTTNPVHALPDELLCSSNLVLYSTGAHALVNAAGREMLRIKRSVAASFSQIHYNTTIVEAATTPAATGAATSILPRRCPTCQH